jgi:hypothetical protein
MILRDIRIFPEVGSCSEDIRIECSRSADMISSYLNRVILKKVRFKTENMRRICIVGNKNPKSQFYSNSSDVLVHEFQFNESEYLSYEGQRKNDFFIKYFEQGLLEISKQIDIPLLELQEGLKSFKEEGYKNEWTYQTRQFKTLGIKCKLNCVVTFEKFVLTLQIVKGKEILFEREVIESLPAEGLFQYYLKDVLLEDNAITVLGKLRDTLLKIEVKTVEDKMTFETVYVAPPAEEPWTWE